MSTRPTPGPAANNETLAVVATAVGSVDFAATRTRAPTAVPLAGDDASSSGSSGGVDAATLGGSGGRRRRTVAGDRGIRCLPPPYRRCGGGGGDLPRNSPRIDVEEGVDLKAVKAAAGAQLAARRIRRAAAAAALAFVILIFVFSSKILFTADRRGVCVT